jgi:ParB family chromosome partitioning protein
MPEKQDEKRRLGKGLSDIFKEFELQEQLELLQQDPQKTKFTIAVDHIVPNPSQPRKKFDETKLEELAASIRQYGILTPILLRPHEGHYEIVTGERRYRAALRCGLQEVPAVLENFDDAAMMEVALIENIQREDLTPIEEARAYANLIQNLKMTQGQMAKKLGKSRPYVANVLRLLDLPESIQSLLENNQLTMGHARTLIGLSESEASALAQTMMAEKLNVRSAERLGARQKAHKTQQQATSLEQALQQVLGRDARIREHEIILPHRGVDDIEAWLQTLQKRMK